MRNFIASMALVSGAVVIVTTFNNGVTETTFGGNALRSTINQQAIAVNTTPLPKADDVTTIQQSRPIVNKVYEISTRQLQSKFSNDEVVTFRDMKGSSTEISLDNLASLATGVYIIRKDSRIYRYTKK